jgi:uncharacterized protein DUF4239
MVSFLQSQPLWLSGLLLVGLPTVLAMLGPVLVRRWVPLDRLAANNEVAGFKFSVVGVLYAVLLAFAIIVVWEKFTDADDIVAREAGAATNVYRLSYGLAEAPATSLRARLSAYLAATISDDWPAMEHANESSSARLALDAVYGSLLVSLSPEGRDGALIGQILNQLDTITQERRVRIAAADGAVPGVIWPVLFGGAAVTIGFTFFFGSQNLLAQSFMTGLLSVVIFSGLWIVLVIDRPFSGAVTVNPDAIAKVLAEFGTPPATH